MKREKMFVVYLDADGHIGSKVVEAIGDYSLGSGFKQYFMVEGSGDSHDLTKDRALLRPGPFSVWKLPKLRKVQAVDLKYFGLITMATQPYGKLMPQVIINQISLLRFNMRQCLELIWTQTAI